MLTTRRLEDLRPHAKTRVIIHPGFFMLRPHPAPLLDLIHRLVHRFGLQEHLVQP